MANENIQELKFQVGEVWKGVYSSSTPYGLANVVQDPTGLSIYRSLKSGNVGHPLNDRTWWFCIIDMSSIKAESDRITALNQAIAQDEALRVAAEELRQQHETERIAAETQRNEAEQARVNAEQERVGAESARATAEQQRITAEQERVSAESARVQAEQARVLSETLRANAEDQRAANEQNRIAAEQQRIERAESDHQRVESDLADIAVYTDSLGAFDLSKHNAVDGVLATYADLSAALTALNALDSKYKYGGMSFKFVLSSDNKYVQYRLMSDTFNTTPANWQGVDDTPTQGSENLVESGGVAKVLGKNIDITNELVIGQLPGYIESNGTITAYSTWFYKTLLLKAGQTITIDASVGNYPTLGIAQSGTVNIGDVVTVVNGNSYTAASDTWIVVSEGPLLRSAIIRESNNIFDTADSEPKFDSKNIVSSDGIANALKNVKVDGKIKQTSSIVLQRAGFNRNVGTNLSAKKGDTIIVTLIDTDGIIPVGGTIPFYHGDPSDGVPYTNLSVGVPTEIALTNDVEDFYIYVPGNYILNSGVITLELKFKSIFATKSELQELTDEVDAVKTACEMPFDNTISLNNGFNSTYDSGITLQAGQEIEVTLIDEEGIVTVESLSLYYNSTSGRYVNLVPDVPTKIQASEQTHFLLYVGSSWISASGNVTLHVEYINTSNIIDVTLPSKSYAYVGGEFNIYNENVAFITQKDRYYIFWSIDNINDYRVYSDRLRILPTSDMIGTHEVTLQILDRFNNSVVYSKSFTLEIVANTPVTNKKVLFIGDSLTNAGYYPHFVEYLSNNGIQSIGTRESEVWSSFVEGRKDIVRHEGRGGWSAMDYVRNYAEYRTDAPNPFWNETTGKFDFSYYISSQGYSRPDAVFINLGTNLVYFLAGTINATKEMITSIHAYDSTIPIFVSLIIPPATQEGRAYSGHGDSHVFEKHARNQRKEYIKEFENKLANVDVSPVYFNLDRYYDFPTAEEPVSQRNPTIVVRQTDGTHPRRFGYYKMGDVYYADMMHILS